MRARHGRCGRRRRVAWFFDTLKARFKIKPPVYLSKSNAIDHLGMIVFENDDGIYLSMQNYIEVVLTKLAALTWTRSHASRMYPCQHPSLTWHHARLRRPSSS